MISLKNYWMGRDLTYAEVLSQEICNNAAETVRRVNQLLLAYKKANPLKAMPVRVRSGWRPPAVNSKTKGAAPKSRHLTGEAIDVEDLKKDLGSWCLTSEGISALESCDLYIEHPSATMDWVHFQTMSPRSGRRIFYP